MYKDPRFTAFRKTRKFYGTPINKYINATVFISSSILLAVIYGITRIPIVQKTVHKFKFVPNYSITGDGDIEYSLERVVIERLQIKKELAKLQQQKQQENKEAPTQSSLTES